jgi:hypothetical protein
VQNTNSACRLGKAEGGIALNEVICPLLAWNQKHSNTGSDHHQPFLLSGLGGLSSVADDAYGFNSAKLRSQIDPGAMQ